MLCSYCAGDHIRTPPSWTLCLLSSAWICARLTNQHDLESSVLDEESVKEKNRSVTVLIFSDICFFDIINPTKIFFVFLFTHRISFRINLHKRL